MTGDFTRLTFDQRKHYRAVLMQQGRVTMDADWNEQQEITSGRIETEAADVIGSSGAPMQAAGFALTPNGSNLEIGPGRYYVDGILCENEEALLFTAQPDLPMAKAPADQGVYFAYLDVWPRSLTALDDPAIREVALGGPDTATRLKTVWQVKLLRVGDVGADINCLSELATWNDLIAPTKARLSARAVQGAPSDNPCIIEPGAGFRRLENQLYRVEIHDSGPLNTATFKWSRDNGSIVAPVDVKGSGTGSITTIKISSAVGQDQARRFATGQAVELVDDTRELLRTPGTLLKIATVNGDVLTVSPAVNLADFPRNPKLRRWDSDGALKVEVPATNDGFLPLEDGAEALFQKAVTYTTGDYWLIPARTATGDLEWPRDTASKPLALPPRGVAHHFCRLAVLSFNGTTWTVLHDCRELFPPLTDITATADDVSFDNTVCEFEGATTVQEALDSLCQRLRSRCTLIARPGDNLQALFDAIDPGQDAHVCLCVGTYELSASVNVSGKGHLHITGAGAGSRIIAASSEAAFIVQNCREVVVEDLYAETRVTGVGGSHNHLNGTFTFLNCEAVTVEGVGLRCGAGPERRAACLTVRDERPESIQGLRRCTVRVLHSNLEVGHQQSGILLVNVGRSVIEDNFLRVAPRPQNLTLSSLAVSHQMRARVRGLMLSHFSMRAAPAGSPAGTINVDLAGRKVSFRTDAALVNAWPPLLAANPAPAGASESTLAEHLTRIADRVILNAGAVPNIPAFRDWFMAVAAEQDPTVASQGIVVGGRSAPDVRIKNNTIEGTLQGIHVGVSHREASPGAADQTGAASIADNRIRILLSRLAERERHGIFVGNCDTLYVENNHAVVQRFGNTTAVPIDGICVHGVLGLMMIVRQNHLQNFTVGVRVVPLFRPPPNRLVFQWLVAQNMMPSSSQTVIAPAQVRRAENFA